MQAGIRIGSIRGIEIRADWSLLIIFTLIAVSLGAGVFPQWHPRWTLLQVWSLALIAAALFFASVLAHEMSHALVGRASGIRVPRITLFVFGGMAQMENEPPSWQSELRMAIVGPVMSLAIGFVCLALASRWAGPAPQQPEAVAEYLSALGPAASVLLWLGTVNVLLGIFNLVPGFPLDGGRVLRAAAWGVTGDLLRATRIASLIGRAVAWLLMGLGLAMLFGATVPFFGRGPVSGLWLILIGWFLSNAALFSYRQLAQREILGGVAVRDVMQTDFRRVAPAMSLRELVDEHLMSSGQRSFPVERDGRFVGLVSVEDLQRGGRTQREDATVETAMTAAERLRTVSPRQNAAEALDLLMQRDVHELPVVEHGRLVGLLSRESLLRWLSLHGRALLPGAGAASHS